MLGLFMKAFLVERNEMNHELKKELLNCVNPRLDLGPNGGWGSFNYLYPQGGGCTISSKKQAMECVNFLRENGREVKEFRQKGSFSNFLEMLNLDATNRW
jgi:hypothetical protein